MQNTNKRFSALDRPETIRQISETKLDLLIIGGGITGAGIALDAASRGISCAVLEMQDFAQGTSSRSTKLVHGGLRYLEQLELGLVREVGLEREIVHTNAAHIVIPEKMILPIIDGGNLGEFTTSVALFLYDFLADVKKEEHRKMLTREETLAKIPLIDSPLLKSGALYYEYKTDDSRLTIEVLKKAREYGAFALNYFKAENFIYENGNVIGVNAVDLRTNEKHKLFAKNIVNATGPWVDSLRDKDNSLKGKRIHHTKGVHIVVSKARFPLNHAMYFDNGDKRMIFAVPRQNIVYIGTTDTDYTDQLENPAVTRADVQYILAAVNRIAPTVSLELSDVKSAWAGLRPLIHEDGKATSELSRKDEIFVSESGLISIAGGKLTGYRVMAKNVTSLVINNLVKSENRKNITCQTKNMRLSGGEFPFYPESIKLTEYADKKFDEAKQTGITSERFKQLFYRYGMNIEMLTNYAFDSFSQCRNTDEAWLRAELWYAVNYESTLTLTDFYVRRTGMIFFNIDDIKPQAEQASYFLQKMLQISENQRLADIADLESELRRAVNFI